MKSLTCKKFCYNWYFWIIDINNTYDTIHSDDGIIDINNTHYTIYNNYGIIEINNTYDTKYSNNFNNPNDSSGIFDKTTIYSNESNDINSTNDINESNDDTDTTSITTKALKILAVLIIIFGKRVMIMISYIWSILMSSMRINSYLYSILQ